MEPNLKICLDFLKKYENSFGSPVFIIKYKSKTKFFVIFDNKKIYYGLNIAPNKKPFWSLPKTKTTNLNDLHNHVSKIFDSDSHEVLLDNISFFIN